MELDKEGKVKSKRKPISNINVLREGDESEDDP
eukprot:CAMPEP_0201282666 /NCGR_PEP_ID=MMETSP1317-20130820/6330_1 /ASSEMBLY_ACC=CAM_ASM_000770 /TAXON_ID=187299 /ORGANISM="Undescribed Undescribed, Strain Undescribed" /LENGTH=32 /DNA_ID= /DNA_START= /DNA_END= /DNA_ORIENTATION=